MYEAMKCLWILVTLMTSYPGLVYMYYPEWRLYPQVPFLRTICVLSNSIAMKYILLQNTINLND